MPLCDLSVGRGGRQGCEGTGGVESKERDSYGFGVNGGGKEQLPSHFTSPCAGDLEASSAEQTRSLAPISSPPALRLTRIPPPLTD